MMMMMMVLLLLEMMMRVMGLWQWQRGVYAMAFQLKYFHLPQDGVCFLIGTKWQGASLFNLILGIRWLINKLSLWLLARSV